MSRNKREGEYCGKLRGAHIRSKQWRQYKFHVCTWYAFHVWDERKDRLGITSKGTP